jgi:hypothetical protein
MGHTRYCSLLTDVNFLGHNINAIKGNTEPILDTSSLVWKYMERNLVSDIKGRI